MRRDFAYALRLLRRSPGFTATAVLTLALGIGANTAVFSVIYQVLLRPLPFPDADRLVLVSEYSPGNVAKTGSPLLRYQERAAQNSVFQQTAAYWDVSGGNGLVFGAAGRSEGQAERLQFSIVTSSFFPLLGVQPSIGRAFSASEDLPGQGAKVFVASHAAWSRLLGGDPAAVGKSFLLDGEPHTLIGVLPAEFDFPEKCSLWIPTGALSARTLHDRVSHQFRMLGRLRLNVPLASAQAEMDRIQERLAQAYPSTDANWRVTVRPLVEELVGNVRASLWIMFGAVAFVLLIACTNVINLLLARAAARQREFAVRTALGAAGSRLVRQALIETLLLVGGGTVLALALAKVALGALVALSAGSIPRFDRPHLSLPVLVFSAGLALAVTLIVGIAPGLHASGLAWPEALRSSQRSGFNSRRGTALRNLLVISEVSLTLLLLSGAGLMLRSFQQLLKVDPGFHPERLTAVRIALPDGPPYLKTAQRAAFLRQLLESLNATPGIEMAAATDRLPLSGETNWGRINIAGRLLLDSAHAPAVEGRAVSANYFRTLGIPLLHGREFTEDDVAAQRHVAIINQQMADRFWPGGDPIGQRVVSAYHPDDSREIVGIVQNIKDSSLDSESPAEMYTPYGGWSTMNIVLKSNLAPSAAVAAVRAQAARLDPGVPVYEVRRMTEVVGQSVARQRFELFLLGVFASIALLLAAVGIYGLLAFAVSRRTHEIGLRMALGARPRGILVLILWQGMKLVAAGVAAGVVASLALTRLISSLLFHVSPVDPLTLCTVTLVLATAGALACWIPARRAMAADPMAALMCE
jgi:putative ABC transport system permease protein